MPKLSSSTFAAALIAALLISCTPAKESPKEPEPESVQLQGSQILGDYTKKLCDKYKECSIQAFADDTDCFNRVKTLLSNNHDWEKMKVGQEAFNTCLTDFTNMTCEAFQRGDRPQSCENL